MASAGLPRIYRIDDPVVEAVVFHGLPGADPTPAIEGDWRPGLQWMVNQRLAGAALDLVKTHGVELPDVVHTTLTAARHQERCRTMLAELSAARVSEIMRGADVPFVVVKGPAMAAIDPVPGARPFLDVDILVEPRRFDDAMAAARAAGFESNTERPAREYYERHCYEGVNLRDQQGRSIDIHHHVPPWWAGRRLTLEHLGAAASATSIAHVDVPLAGPLANLFIASLHLVSDQNLPGYKLLSWRDVVASLTSVTPERVASAAAQFELGWWLHWIAGQMPPTDALASVIAVLEDAGLATPPLWGVQRVKALSASGERGMNLAFAARLPAGRAAAYVAGQLVPSRRSRAARLNGDESLLSWWRFAGRSFFQNTPSNVT